MLLHPWASYAGAHRNRQPNGAEFARRLMDLGVIEEAELEVVGFAPLGDPMEIRLGNSRLSLRRREAAGIEVKMTNDE